MNESIIAASDDHALFRDRETELNTLLGCKEPLLIVAMPTMGKSMLLERLGEELQNRSEAAHPVLLNLGKEPEALREDFSRLCERLVPGLAASEESDTLAERTASHILGSGTQWWLLLDNVDRLTHPVARKLRQWISRTLQRLDQEGAPNLLRFVAASRIGIPAFKGLLPTPSFRVLQLAEFGEDILTAELRQAGEALELHTDVGFYAELGSRVQRVTEGLPALLHKTLEWIKSDRFNLATTSFAQLDRQLFGQVVRPYIENSLLSEGALLPDTAWSIRDQPLRDALTEALAQLMLGLSVFRLLTRSHLKEAASELRAALQTLSTLGDPFDLLGRMAVIEPQRELWYTPYGAVRRLYFKYRYATRESQLQAHEAAFELYNHWPQELAGADATSFYVERFFHAAECMRLKESEGALERVQTLFAESVAQMETTAAHRTFLAQLNGDSELNQSVEASTGRQLSSLLQLQEAP